MQNNSAKSFIDISDQMALYAFPVRSGIKYYWKVMFKLPNVHTLHKHLSADQVDIESNYFNKKTPTKESISALQLWINITPLSFLIEDILQHIQSWLKKLVDHMMYTKSLKFV